MTVDIKDQKLDLRIVRTRLLLKNALLALLEEKSLEKISVMDICDKALVHRATFYKHFDDKYDLFSYSLEEIRKSFSEFYKGTVVSDNPVEAYLSIADNLLTFLQAHSKTVVAIIENNKTEAAFIMFFDEIEKGMRQHLAHIRSDVNTQLPLPISSSFLTGGFLSLAIWWLKNTEFCSKEQLLSYLGIILKMMVKNPNN